MTSRMESSKFNLRQKYTLSGGCRLCEASLASSKPVFDRNQICLSHWFDPTLNGQGTVRNYALDWRLPSAVRTLQRGNTERLAKAKKCRRLKQLMWSHQRNLGTKQGRNQSTAKVLWFRNTLRNKTNKKKDFPHGWNFIPMCNERLVPNQSEIVHHFWIEFQSILLQNFIPRHFAAIF